MHGMADLADTITDQAGKPASFSEEGRSESARSLDDLIKADIYLAGKAARSKRRRGISFTKMIAPGALSDQGGTCSSGGNFGCGGCP